MAAPVESSRLKLAIEARHTTLPLPGGRALPFTDVALALRNLGNEVVRRAVLRLTIRQDAAVLCEGSDALMADLPAAGLAPGEAVEWGFYALLQAVDRGFASKVHLFGPKAALNWLFHVEVTAADRVPGEAGAGTPEHLRATVRWRALGDGTGGIGLEIDG